MRTVNVVVPDGIDDLARPSGGNTYDRHVCRELVSLGWSVHEHAVPGSWPRPDAASFTALACALQRIPGDAIVLLDGLVASTAPEVLVSQSRRLRLIVLVHMLLGHRPVDDDARIREGAVVSAAEAIITTSAWARRRLLELYSLPADRVHVARPGVDAADLASGTATGGALLCVAAVTFRKGYDVLLDALEKLMDMSWHCVCVGSLDRDPAFVECLRHRSSARGLGDRVRLAGTRTGAELDSSYAARRPGGARVAFRNVRNGHHRGFGPWFAGPRRGGWRGSGSHRLWPRRGSAWTARPATRTQPRSPRRSGAGYLTPSSVGCCDGPPASAAIRFLGGRPPRPSSRVSWPRRRGDG